MFNVKKNPVPGMCARMRCKNGARDLLCEPCEAEWKAAGSPALTTAKPEPAKKAPGTALALSEAETKELTEEREKAAKWLEQIRLMPMDTDQNMELAGKIRERAKARIGLLEKQYKTVADPLNAALKAARNLINPNKDFYESIVKVIDKRLNEAYQARKALQAQALARVEAVGGKADAATLAVAHDTPELPSSVKVTETFEYVVKSFKDLPDEYKIHNHIKIMAVLKEKGMEANIPGIEVRSVAQIGTNRSKE